MCVSFFSNTDIKLGSTCRKLVFVARGDGDGCAYGYKRMSIDDLFGSKAGAVCVEKKKHQHATVQGCVLGRRIFRNEEFTTVDDGKKVTEVVVTAPRPLAAVHTLFARVYVISFVHCR